MLAGTYILRFNQDSEDFTMWTQCSDCQFTAGVVGSSAYFLAVTSTSLIINEVDLTATAFAPTMVSSHSHLPAWESAAGEFNAANSPGTRKYSSTTIDATNGLIYLFGGELSQQADTFLNDLWVYSLDVKQWSWIHNGTEDAQGSYPSEYGMEGTPGYRERSCFEYQNGDKILLFGGVRSDPELGESYYNDLFEFDVSTKMWTWVGGSSSVNDTGSSISSGSKIPFSAENFYPGARSLVCSTDPETDGIFLEPFYGFSQSVSEGGMIHDRWFLKAEVDMETVDTSLVHPLSTNEDEDIALNLTSLDAEDGGVYLIGPITSGQSSVYQTTDGVTPGDQVLVESARSKALVEDTDGGLIFELAPNYHGNITFGLTYIFDDGRLTRQPSTLVLEVRSVPDMPTMTTSRLLDLEEDERALVVLDIEDGDGLDTLSVQVTVFPENGTLYSVNPSGTAGAPITNLLPTIPLLSSAQGFRFIFRPDKEFSGDNLLELQVDDGDHDVLTANITFSVKAINDAPVAVDGEYEVGQDESLLITLTGTDAEGSPLSFLIDDLPSHGTLYQFNASGWAEEGSPDISSMKPAELLATNIATEPVSASLSGYIYVTDSSGRVVYIPDSTFIGEDSMTFTADDGTRESVSTGVITLSVVSRAEFVAESQSVQTDEDTPLLVDLWIVDGETSMRLPLNYAADYATILPNMAESPARASLFTVNRTSGEPVSFIHGVVSLREADTHEDVDPFRVYVSPASDLNGNPLTYFSYIVTANSSVSSEGTIDIVVNAINDAPRATGGEATSHDFSDITVSLDYSDTEVDMNEVGAFVQACISHLPSIGTLQTTDGVPITQSNTCVNSTQVVYIPNTSKGVYQTSFRFHAYDGLAESESAIVELQVGGANSNPLSYNVSITGVEDEAVLIVLNVTDAEDAVAGALVTSLPTEGDLFQYAQGRKGLQMDTPGAVTDSQNRVIWQPPADRFGQINELFSFVASDSEGAQSVLTSYVSVSLEAVNDAPVASGAVVSMSEDEIALFVFSGNDVDSANSDLVATVLSLPVVGTLSPVNPDTGAVESEVIDTAPYVVTHPQRILSYRPPTDQASDGTFDLLLFQLSDGELNSTAVAVQFEVRPVNDPPIALDFAANGIEDEPLLITLKVSDADKDETLQVSVLNLPDVLIGTLFQVTVASSGAITAGDPISATTGMDITDPLWRLLFVPTENVFGTDLFNLRYRVEDSSGESSEATVAVSITPLSDIPTVATERSVTLRDGTTAIVELSAVNPDLGAISFTIVSLPPRGRLFSLIDSNNRLQAPILATDLPVNITTTSSSLKLYFDPSGDGSAYPYGNMTYFARSTGGVSNLAVVTFSVSCSVGLVNNIFSRGALCKVCPVGAICSSDGSFQPANKDGFYRVGSEDPSQVDTLVFLPCEPASACPAGAPGTLTTCSSGYSGVRCGSCKDGYFRRDLQCFECPDSGNNKLFVFMAVVLCFLLIVALVYFARTRVDFGHASILITFFQTMAIFAKIRLAWSDDMNGMYTIMSIFNFNYEVLAFECDLPTLDYRWRWSIFMLVPFLVLSLLAFSLLVLVLVLVLRKRFCPRWSPKWQFCPERIDPEEIQEEREILELNLVLAKSTKKGKDDEEEDPGQMPEQKSSAVLLSNLARSSSREFVSSAKMIRRVSSRMKRSPSKTRRHSENWMEADDDIKEEKKEDRPTRGGGYHLRRQKSGQTRGARTMTNSGITFIEDKPNGGGGATRRGSSRPARRAKSATHGRHAPAGGVAGAGLMQSSSSNNLVPPRSTSRKYGVEDDLAISSIEPSFSDRYRKTKGPQQPQLDYFDDRASLTESSAAILLEEEVLEENGDNHVIRMDSLNPGSSHQPVLEPGQDGLYTPSDESDHELFPRLDPHDVRHIRRFQRVGVIRHFYYNLVAGGMLFLHVIYLSISAKAIELFDCTEQDDGEYYLDAEPSLRCYDDWWWELFPAAVFCTVVYALGIPLWFSWVLLKSRHREKESEEATPTTARIWNLKYWNLTNYFTHECYYWNLMLLFRKMCLVLAKIFGTGYPMFQAALSLIILVGATLLQERYHPYRPFKGLNELENMTLLCCLFVLILGITAFGEPGFSSSSSREVIGILTIVAVALTLAVAFILVFRQIRLRMRAQSIQEQKEQYLKAQLADIKAARESRAQSRADKDDSDTDDDEEEIPGDEKQPGDELDDEVKLGAHAAFVDAHGRRKDQPGGSLAKRAKQRHEEVQLTRMHNDGVLDDTPDGNTTMTNTGGDEDSPPPLPPMHMFEVASDEEDVEEGSGSDHDPLFRGRRRQRRKKKKQSNTTNTTYIDEDETPMETGAVPHEDSFYDDLETDEEDVEYYGEPMEEEEETGMTGYIEEQETGSTPVADPLSASSGRRKSNIRRERRDGRNSPLSDLNRTNPDLDLTNGEIRVDLVRDEVVVDGSTLHGDEVEEEEEEEEESREGTSSGSDAEPAETNEYIQETNEDYFETF